MITSKIREYQLFVKSKQTVSLPLRSKILNLLIDNNDPVLYVLIDTKEKNTESLDIHMHLSDDETVDCFSTYLGTIKDKVDSDIDIDWHVFVDIPLNSTIRVDWRS
jgi:hypothetical protein